MGARWWYRGEKEQNINKKNYCFISKTIKMYTRGFETESLFSANFTTWFTFLMN